MNRIKSLLLLILGIAAVVTALLIAPNASAAKKSPKFKLRTVTKSVSATVVEPDDNGYFSNAQYMDPSCKRNEKALSIGIINAPQPISDLSHGFNSITGYAAGVPGKYRYSFQLLCASGPSSAVTTMRYPGKHTPGISRIPGGGTAGIVRASAKCRKGDTALGTALSLGFAPAVGGFSSVPRSKNKWDVVAHVVPDRFYNSINSGAYAAVACLNKKHVKQTTLVKKSVKLAANSASVNVSCPGGRRPLGWGVSLMPYVTYVREGRWVTPTVSQARFLARSMKFTFSKDSGTTSTSSSTQTAHVVCGKLTGK